MRTILTTLATLAIAFLLTSTASAQSRPCRFSVETTGTDGTVVSVCADSVRQINAASAAIGALDPRRSASTMTSPDVATTHISSGYPMGYGYGQGYGGGYYPPPDDQRQARAIRDSIMSGVRVTSFEGQLRQADDDGIRDGQHEAVMSAIRGLRLEIARQQEFLQAAIATGNARLERSFRAKIAELERQMKEQEAGKSGSSSDGKTSTPAPTTPAPASTTPTKPAMVEQPERRLTQSRKKN